MSKSEPYCLLDVQADELVVVPALAGIHDEVRVVTSARGEPESTVLAVIAPAGRARIPLASLDPISSRSIKLQQRSNEAWADLTQYVPLESFDNLVSDNIRPLDWGIEEDSIAVLRDPESRGIVMRRSVPAGGSAAYRHDPADDRKLLLEFHRPTDGKVGLGQRLGPPLRWVPQRLRGKVPDSVTYGSDGLHYSRRENVTLAPCVLRRAGKGALNTQGFLGAWAAGEPVVEAMDFVLGRQEMLYQPEAPEAKARVAGTAIYLGRPHKSWGHFLTQGLSRVWLALRYPDIPVVWDTPRPLPDHQQNVLSMLGLRNRQYFLKEPTEWEEIIFPFPGVCIGDFVLSGYTDTVGCIPCAKQVPGKRLFMSRSSTTNFPGGIEGQVDALAERHGFTVFHPEQHPIEEQLWEISSAEVVMAVEGSSLHTPLLLRDPVGTKFWALSRHRGGGGLFEHVKAAKDLQYETLNFLRSPLRGARDPIDLDLQVLDDALRKTDGLTANLGALEPYLERPWPVQRTYEAHLRHTQVRSGPFEQGLHRAQMALAAGNLATASKLLSILS